MTAQYSRAIRALHWSSAALLLGPYLTVWMVGRFADPADAAWLAMIHRSSGLVMLGLTVVRLAVRRGSAIPAMPPDVPRVQRLGARLAVAGLYGLLLAQPLLGLLGTMIHGDRATVFGSLLLPLALPVDRALGRALFWLHGWIGLTLLGLAAVHALAALHHHLIRRDTVLVSMLPGGCAPTGRRPS